MIGFLNGESLANTLLVLCLVASVGLGLGSLRLLNIHLGVAGVLFSGIFFGHMGMSISPPVLDFLREFGLILFVYTVGLQVGPGFFSSLRRHGLKFNLIAASIVILGALFTVGVRIWGDIDPFAIVGLYSGATTNTPSLGAAQQAIKGMGAANDAARLPDLGYAVAYPFGILGVIVAMIALRRLFRIDIKSDAALLQRTQADNAAALDVLNIEVTNPSVDGESISHLTERAGEGLVISRIFHNESLGVAQDDTTVHTGDVMLAVGPRAALQRLCEFIGKKSDLDLKKIPSRITSRPIVVTKKTVIGKSIESLRLGERYDATVTRVSRTEVEFPATQDFRLQFGDTLLVVADERVMDPLAEELGNSMRKLNDPQIIPIFVGIALGVMIGSWPISIPGVPAPVMLGLAGGPLITAILLSRLGRMGPLNWYMPTSANFMLREMGIVLFLSCVGLRAGDQFFDVLFAGDGWRWMAWGAAITFVPLFTVGLFARAVLKINFVSLCGLLAGGMTDPPALAFARDFVRSEGPSVSYATVYPLVMILRILSAQILVMFFLRS